MAEEHLTHGWEPELDIGDSLLRGFVLAMAERNAFLAERTGGRAARWDDLAVADPASLVKFENAALLLQPPAYVDVADAVRRTADFYPPERHHVFLSAWPTPDLSWAGMELTGHPPFMVRSPGGAPPQLPEGLRVVPVTDRAELADFVDTLLIGFSTPQTRTTPMGDRRILDGPIRLFVGYADGRPVATSGAWLGPGIVVVDWVATLPAYRRRGIGTALTWAATMTSPGDPAALIASDEGRPIYEAMGYLRMMRLTIWHRPPLSSGIPHSTG